jgi:hypothetical protein
MLAWLALASAPAAWGAVRYVKSDSTSTTITANFGASWATAYPSLQTALAAAQSGDEIRVAAGTYKPTTGMERTISFVMTAGVAIYGGFAGTETSRDQRDWSAHPTILSGDIGVSDDASDNSYHVVVGANSAVLDGFTITGGYASGSGDNMYGGGMFNASVSSTTIANCTFVNNTASYYTSSTGLTARGGGMYNKNASPTVTNCSFVNNDSDGGGGMYNCESSSPTVTNCTFTNNDAGYGGGGGIDNFGASLTIANCTFENNWSCYGGGMFNQNSSLTATKCTFENNNAHYGGGIFNQSSSLIVTNCTFSNNEAGDGGDGNGGGMYNSNNGSSSLTVTNCTFANNTCDACGGGMKNVNSSPTVTNCAFVNNTATIGDGGGMDNVNASPTVTNCTFAKNTCYYEGGGMFNGSSSPTVTNCTFVNNTATMSASGSGGGMFNFNDNSAAPTVINCIFWRNSAAWAEQIHTTVQWTTSFTNCDIQDAGSSDSCWDSYLGIDGGGNIDADPLFVDASNPAGKDGILCTSDDGLRLRDGSPCINAGTATGAPATDILSNARIRRPDIGAYEYQYVTAAEQWTLYR